MATTCVTPRARHASATSRSGQKKSREGNARALDIPRRRSWGESSCNVTPRAASSAVARRASRFDGDQASRVGDRRRRGALRRPRSTTRGPLDGDVGEKGGETETESRERLGPRCIQQRMGAPRVGARVRVTHRRARDGRRPVARWRARGSDEGDEGSIAKDFCGLSSARIAPRRRARRASRGPSRRDRKTRLARGCAGGFTRRRGRVDARDVVELIDFSRHGERMRRGA